MRPDEVKTIWKQVVKGVVRLFKTQVIDPYGRVLAKEDLGGNGVT